MLPQVKSSGMALGAITLLSYASLAVAGVARSHGQMLRQNQNKRDVSSTVSVALSDLKTLEGDYTEFSQIAQKVFGSPLAQQAMGIIPDLKDLEPEFQKFDAWFTNWLDTALHLSPSNSTGTTCTSLPGQSSPPYPTGTGVIGGGTAQPTGTATGTGSVPTGTSTSSSGAKGSDIVAVYWGNSGATNNDLPKVCSDPSVDIVLLAFLNNYNSGGDFTKPNYSFGGTCSDKSPSSCADIGKQVADCQKGGKKVMLSLGGYQAKSDFQSDDQAKTFANTLWNMFGGGKDSSITRPFGDVAVDGFDIDNETGNPQSQQTFVEALRSKIQGASKKFYLSAAPQSDHPDKGNPDAAMLLMDYVWVQFYNTNGQKDIGTPGFIPALKEWASALSKGPNGGPLLLAGAPAAKEAAPSGGYLDAAGMTKAIGDAKSAVPGFGGIMLWDGSYAQKNQGYLSSIKSALKGGKSSRK